MSKADYNFCKSLGLCPRCNGKHKAAPGRVFCEDCLEKYRDEKAAVPQERKREIEEKRKPRRNALRAERRESGLCIYCGKPVYRGGKRCYEHTLQNRRHQRTLRERKRLEKPVGACLMCSDPALPGYKLCEKHYKMALAAAEKGREAQTESRASHPWGIDNKIIFLKRQKNEAQCG